MESKPRFFNFHFLTRDNGLCEAVNSHNKRRGCAHEEFVTKSPSPHSKQLRITKPFSSTTSRATIAPLPRWMNWQQATLWIWLVRRFNTTLCALSINCMQDRSVMRKPSSTKPSPKHQFDIVSTFPSWLMKKISGIVNAFRNKFFQMRHCG